MYTLVKMLLVLHSSFTLQLVLRGYLLNLGVAQNLASVSRYLQRETEYSKEIPKLPGTQVCQSVVSCPVWIYRLRSGRRKPVFSEQILGSTPG